MIISKETKERIKEHALKNQSEECCGLIVQTKEKFDLETFECRNSAENKQTFFSLNPKDYLKASLRGEIKAVYHSHISDNEEFSVGDKENSKKHQVDYVLYNIKNDSFHLYEHKKNGVSNLSKKFKWGVADCIMLVVDYLEEKGIKIKNDILTVGKYNSRDSHWPERFPNLIEDVLNVNNKFKKINKNSMQEGDVLCFSIFKSSFSPLYDHWAVLVGDNQIYHHPVNRHPTVEDLGKFYRSKLIDVYRYSK